MLRTFRRLKHSCVGIDLGTTNSAVASIVGGEARILENLEGARTTPSVVAFSGNNILVGNPAKRQAAINPGNTFFATKRLIGRKFTDPETQRDLDTLPYRVVPNSNGDAALETTTGERKSPAEIGSLILNNMKQIAENNLGNDVTRAVVTVPAYFNDSQRLATKSAGKLVGLDVLRVVNEPTAAALAYGIGKERKNAMVAVFDLGGGTFDISILDIEDGVFEVRATNGNTHLGGEDFDNVVLAHMLARVRNESGVDLLKNVAAVQRIKEAAEKAKIELSHVKETEINLPFLADGVHLKFTLKEEELDAMTMGLIEQTIGPVKKCIRDADLTVGDIDEVLLVGGMTRMPKIRLVVEGIFNKKPSTAVNPDEAVALGAAIQGAVLLGEVKNVLLLDVTPLLLGIETYGGIFSPLIPRNSPVPVKKEQIFLTAVDSQTGVEIRVYQGERQLVRDNKLIGDFKLSNIPPGPKGSPQIAVQFSIDADGIIDVSATDKTKYPEDLPFHNSNNTVSIQVAQQGMTESEIEQLVAESEAQRLQDKEMVKLFEHASRAEILCTDTDNAVLLFGKMMGEEEVREIEKKVAEIRKMIEVMRKGEFTDVKALTEGLNDMQKVCMMAIKGIAERQQREKEEESKK